MLKTKRKIERWAEELLNNNAVIGNISIRLDPATAEHAVVQDDDQLDLMVYDGSFDCAVDSLSLSKPSSRRRRARSAHSTSRRASLSVCGSRKTPLAKRVATDYNTRGDKVNDSAAKYAHQANAPERMARLLMQRSAHLSINNIEPFKNTVSASSPKLMAFNTLAQAIELSMGAGPAHDVG